MKGTVVCGMQVCIVPCGSVGVLDLVHSMEFIGVCWGVHVGDVAGWRHKGVWGKAWYIGV